MRTPGLFDLQVNGFAGVDFNDAALTAEALDHALAAMLRTGVIACLPTLITAAPDTLASRLHALDRAVAGSRLGPTMVPGFHLEGPFLNGAEGYAGCHPRQCMMAPDVALLDRLAAPLARPVLLITVAPELDGALSFIETQTRVRGRVIALGHTAARRETIAAACDAGATLSTHLGNALPQPQPKFDNPLMAQLAEDRLAASFIGDGIHVPPHALCVMIRAKGLSRCVLVSDAVAAAGAAPGRYRFADMTVERTEDGAVRVPGTARLAGSALTLDDAVRRVAALGLAAPEGAVALAGAHPRALLAARGHRIDPGEVVWSADLRPLRVRAGEVSVEAA
ncbi:MAG: N-acetylglucosamine-6-phosphate deacetylase [Acetobacteraceae bacterium]|nr:N-acetylglucosamine-6-phosphate deacetylase [Acetobacteraceae bacterium]